MSSNHEMARPFMGFLIDPLPLFPRNERKRIGTTTNQREGMSTKEFRFVLNKMVKTKHKIIKVTEKLFIIIIHFLNLDGI